MGRSRSREKDRERKDRKEKDKDRKRSRSGKRDRSREKEKKEKKEREEAPPPPRQRSPEVQVRRWRFDSPPKEEEYQRDAMLTGNPLGLGGVAAALQGGLNLAGGMNAISPLALAADTKGMRELYVGNLPAGITSPQLVQFLNQVAQAVKVNTLPGEPVTGATMGGGGLFAFVEFRTAEEAANGLRLNGVELLNCQLKVGRPKGYTGPESAGGGPLALGNGAPGLGDLMAQHGALGRPGQLMLPGMPGAGPATAIDHRLCLINIPTFVTEDRIKELLITFGQLKFYAMQKDEEGKSVGVVFFEYCDLMTQQQARAALEGLELGSKKLSVKKPEEVIELGLVAKVQKIGARVVPSKILYLKNIVTAEELVDETSYNEICADIRLEGEQFGAILSIEVPRPRNHMGGGGATNALTNGGAANTGPLALADSAANAGDPSASAPAAPAAPVVSDLSMALVPVGLQTKAAPLITLPGQGAMFGPGIMDVPGIGYAFLEFATIEGCSKAKKAMNGRKFGPNLVEAEYFSEEKYHAKDFARPLPNTDEPKNEAGDQLALIGADAAIDEAPALVD
mmetsp:Transcript_53539/g.116853  ORF Transcript_53539/g.116853 Transcript_53539/m.116853 type:complete len:567 (-) Transcript_53539:133-1833(-)